MSDNKVMVELDWEHALVLPQLLDVAVFNEKKRLAKQTTPRWQMKTEAKIRAGEHAKEQINQAVMAKIVLFHAEYGDYKP